MSIPFSELTKNWSPERMARVNARAQTLINEERTLRDLRKARDLTQAQLAKTLGIGQDHVSRLEQRSDMLLSTLVSYVQAMGGNLRFLAEFPDRPPVLLTSLGDVFDKPEKPKRKRGKKPESSPVEAE
jgi:transcriptional regulator with XRE-family HTH domain